MAGKSNIFTYCIVFLILFVQNMFLFLLYIFVGFFCFFFAFFVLFHRKKFEDTKGVIRSRK